MATEISTMQVAPSRIRLSWSGIFSGLFVTLGVWTLLYALGLAAGLSALDPNDPGSARAAGIGTGIWSVLVPIIALFCGGLVCTRGAALADRVSGAIQGVVLWGLTTVVGVLVVGTAMTSLVSGVVQTGRAAAGAVGGALSGMDMGNLQSALGVDANDLLAPVNQQLRAEGKPTITPQQLQNASGEVLRNALQQGRLDREMLIGALVRETNLSRGDVESLATRMETQYQQTKESAQAKVGSAAQTVQTGALKAAEATGKALWGVFFSLLLSLIACVAGAVLGVGIKARMKETEPAAVAPLGGRPGEVYP